MLNLNIFKLLTLPLLFLMTSVYADNPPPFVNAIRVGNILYLSGQIGSASPGKPPILERGIEKETRQTMENIKQVLQEYGLSMDKIFKCTVMMADMKEWNTMNKIYATYFENGHYPTRSAFGTTGLALDARVEIECMARA